MRDVLLEEEGRKSFILAGLERDIRMVHLPCRIEQAKILEEYSNLIETEVSRP
jgi:hypothetical protein